jgi:hypothetical protein
MSNSSFNEYLSEIVRIEALVGNHESKNIKSNLLLCTPTW